ncbi:MAG TPA: SPOR domain-containing protein [Candidatus Saccharimonadia bacterium]|nr:SPOR domain-containing protein [Candidatus Saccharimonadia bacterium]
MDASVKQRLVGATVLVVLAVIFLPMVFDGSEESRTESIDLGIPAEPDRDFETRVVPLDAPTPLPAPDPGTIVTVDANAPDRPDAHAGTDAAPASKPPAALAMTVPKPAPAAPAAAHAAANTAAPAPATATTPVPESTAPAASARGRYAVSFGSYARADNAVALVASLQQGGVAARAEPVDVNGQPGMRVRAGPFVDRAEAERVRLLAKRARADAPGAIIEIDEARAPDSAPAAADAKPASGWAVQVAAYQAEADATSQRDKLRASGFAAYVDAVRTEAGTMYRVRIGPETQRANAESLRGTLKSKLGLDGFVVPHP